MKGPLLILIIFLFTSSCAHVISEEIRSRADRDVPLQMVFQNPDSFRGRVIILGGSVVRSMNRKDGTYIEVLEKPLNYRGIPRYSDYSLGRFIVLHEGYLDTAIFSRGRHVTLAGEVMGKKIQKLDEIDYTYLFIKSLEIRLLDPYRGIPIHVGLGVSHSF